VAMSLGAGSITGGVVNARLAKEDTDTALATPARVSWPRTRVAAGDAAGASMAVGG